MKKIFMVALVAATSLSVAQAQDEFKPKAGDVTTDFSLFANGIFNMGNSPLQLHNGSVPNSVGTGALNEGTTGLLKGRYFFQDDLAFRLSLGLGTESFKLNNEQTNNLVERKLSTSTIFLGLGVEKHFAGTNRLSPYIGAQLYLGSYSAKVNGSSDVTVGGTRTQVTSTAKNAPGFVFGGGLFLGADYYIAPKVFLGVEAGLDLTSKSLGKSSGSTTTTITPSGGSGTTTTVNNDGTIKYSGSNIGTNLQAGFKIGFVF